MLVTRSEGPDDLLVELGDTFLLVVERDNDGKQWASLAIILPRDRAAVVAHLILMRLEWRESTEPVTPKDRPGSFLIECREVVGPIPLNRLE